MTVAAEPTAPWHAAVTSSQWLVLVIASAGWVFDTFEGQLRNITRDEMLRELLVDTGTANNAASLASWRKLWGDVFLAVSLLGGALGGIAFGSLADRFGRKPMQILSGRLKGIPGMDLRFAVSVLSLLFAFGFVMLWWLPETRGQALPE